jgi:hypothetical protein
MGKLVVPPTISSVLLSNGLPQFWLTGLARPSVQIQATTNLAASWLILTNLVFTNGTSQFIDSDASTQPAKYYRAMVQ